MIFMYKTDNVFINTYSFIHALHSIQFLLSLYYVNNSYIFLAVDFVSYTSCNVYSACYHHSQPCPQSCFQSCLQSCLQLCLPEVQRSSVISQGFLVINPLNPTPRLRLCSECVPTLCQRHRKDNK